MATDPTIFELRKAAIVSDEEIEEALCAYLADPQTHLFRFVSGYTLDVAAAVQAHPFAKAALSSGKAAPRRARSSVRTAILLAHPVKE